VKRVRGANILEKQLVAMQVTVFALRKKVNFPVLKLMNFI
jgi:hypothetical protein